jgi:hypothetical protein
MLFQLSAKAANFNPNDGFGTRIERTRLGKYVQSQSILRDAAALARQRPFAKVCEKPRSPWAGGETG